MGRLSRYCASPLPPFPLLVDKANGYTTCRSAETFMDSSGICSSCLRRGENAQIPTTSS